MAANSSTNAASFFGRSSSRGSSHTPNRVRNTSGATKAPASRVLEEVFAQAPLEKRTRRNFADENRTYQPGMLLQDHPPMAVSSDSEPGDDEAVFAFSESLERERRSSVTVRSDEIGSLKIMLQQQQAMLRSVLSKQETIEEKQDFFERKLNQLEEKNMTSSSPSPSSSNSGGRKRKRIVCSEISVCYYH